MVLTTLREMTDMDDERLTGIMRVAQDLVVGGNAVHVGLPQDGAPDGRMERLDGTARYIHVDYFLAQARDRRGTTEQAWWAGSLLTLGDALRDVAYIDHAPELELVYHLRNAVAHGNRIHFTDYGRKRLASWPAHNKLAMVKGGDIEITLDHEGRMVLFDLVKPADLADLFDSVDSYLASLRADSLGIRWWTREPWWPAENVS
jgi:hypothetical protein